MFVLPKNYEEMYPCINSNRTTSKIYANPNYTEAYKIYLEKFNYDKEKMNNLLLFYNQNVLSPTDILTIQDKNEIVGYKMKYDDGVSLSKLTDANFSSLINASLEFIDTIKDISNHNFLITDPNVDNIIFSNNYKLVDVYSFLWAYRFSKDSIFQRNLKKVNISILSGLFGLSYSMDIEKCFKNYNSKNLERIQNLNTNSQYYLYQYLSIIQDTLKEDSLKLIKIKIR